MNDTTKQNKLNIMTQRDIETCGWIIPSFKQLSENMQKRLKKIRGENDNDETFLIRHNYKAAINSHQV